MDLAKQNTQKTLNPLPAGLYVVSDPCYYFPSDNSDDRDDPWVSWLNAAWKDVDPNLVQILDAELDGFRIVASSTAYGDGIYNDQDGHSYSVDAGMIGVIPLNALAMLMPVEVAKATATGVDAVLDLVARSGGRIIFFPKEFNVEYSKDAGVISIGHLSINTGDESE